MTTTMTKSLDAQRMHVSGLHMGFNLTAPILLLVISCTLATTMAWLPPSASHSLHGRHHVASTGTLCPMETQLPVMKVTSILLRKSLSKRFTSSSDDENSVNRDSDSDEVFEAIGTNQEEVLEKLSLSGAERIAAMGIPERAKRAMLAEQVEDRIFELTDVLEKLVQDGAGSGELVKKSNREKAVQVARETKALQKQYEDLVSGRPSSMLQSLESIMGTTGSSRDNRDEK